MRNYIRFLKFFVKIIMLFLFKIGYNCNVIDITVSNRFQSMG